MTLITVDLSVASYSPIASYTELPTWSGRNERVISDKAQNRSKNTTKTKQNTTPSLLLTDRTRRSEANLPLHSKDAGLLDVCSNSETPLLVPPTGLILVETGGLSSGHQRRVGGVEMMVGLLRERGALGYFILFIYFLAAWKFV